MANINIKWKEVKALCEAGCTGVQVADYLGISYDTLTRRCLSENNTEFADFKRQSKSKGDALLHVAQFKRANKGSERMLIWLGKNRLGQSDRIETKVDIFTGLSQIRGEAVGMQEDMRGVEDELLADD